MKATFSAIALAVLQARGQNAAPAFEIASVKPSAPASRGNPSRSFLPGGRFVAKELTVLDLILTAYEVPRLLVEGGPAWFTSEKFDIDARATDPATRSPQLRLMLRSLLAERFGLKMTMEPRSLSVYTLTVAKSGQKLVKAEPRDCP